MGKNFSKAGSAKVIGNVAKVEQEKAKVVVLQNIKAENLVDNPQNGEDISQTMDLEESMKQNGFTDPLEVTDFGMENGKYMILSGHRRRAAGVKVFGGGYIFPCVVRHFDNAQDVQNYTLMANSQRDSAKDPCLFAVRYKMHEEYLAGIGFNGSMREEIAKRLGISVQQADRYNSMNRIILPVWDMVRAEQVGMSSVVPMAKHSEAEQSEICNIMQEALKKDVNLTRDTVKTIIDGYREGKRSWAEIADLPRDSGLPLSGFMNTDNGVTRDYGNSDRSGEGYVGYDPIGAEYDRMDEDKEKWEKEQGNDAVSQEEDYPGNGDNEENDNKEKNELSPKEQQLKRGAEIAKLMTKLDTNLGDVWTCEDKDAARGMVINMSSLVQALIDEMYRMTESWDMPEEFENALEEAVSAVEQYKS